MTDVQVQRRLRRYGIERKVAEVCILFGRSWAVTGLATGHSASVTNGIVLTLAARAMALRTRVSVLSMALMELVEERTPRG